jgi:hypothetical protein
MMTLRCLLLSAVLLAGCTASKELDLKQKEEALHRGLTAAAKRADPARNLKEASDAIRSFKISDAADAGIKRYETRNQPLAKPIPKSSDQPGNKSKPSQPIAPERKSP